MTHALFTAGFWVVLVVAVLVFAGCVLALVILTMLAVDVWRTPVAKLPDPETVRMALLRDQLDELWQDDEDPLRERAADAAMWERELESTWRLAS